MDPLLPQRAIIDELLSNAAESRVRANEAVFRASAAMNRANQLMKEMRRLRAETHAAAARHDDEVPSARALAKEPLLTS